MAEAPGTRRFASTVPHYLAGRPAYPAALIARVAQLCGLGHSHRLLDLGCGPAQIAIAFARFAGVVIGMDPEPEMLRAAAAGAAEAGVSLELVQGSDADLGPALAPLRMVTMGRSFHWMDRAETLRRLDGILEVEGVVVLFDGAHPKLPDNAWLGAFREVADRYAAGDAVVAFRRSAEWLRHEAVLLDSPFAALERISVIERRRTPVARLVDRAFSLSSTSPARLGAKADCLGEELRAALAPFAADGAVTEVVEMSALLARRPGSRASA